MQIQDLVNGLYETAGSIFILNHVRSLWKSRQPWGVSILSTIFFTTWGMWNLYYYPHLGQWFSFLGGLALVITNTIWIGSLWYLRRLEVR